MVFAYFVKISIDFVGYNVESALNMALTCCPVGFSEDIIAVFIMTKSQIVTKCDKNSKTF